jgi:hypothetical protein
MIIGGRTCLLEYQGRFTSRLQCEMDLSGAQKKPLCCNRGDRIELLSTLFKNINSLPDYT